MTVSSIEIKKLQASEGMILTNGEVYSSVGGYVYLPETSDASKWHEITEEAYEEIMSQMDESVSN